MVQEEHREAEEVRRRVGEAREGAAERAEGNVSDATDRSGGVVRRLPLTPTAMFRLTQRVLGRQRSFLVGVRVLTPDPSGPAQGVDPGDPPSGQGFPDLVSTPGPA